MIRNYLLIFLTFMIAVNKISYAESCKSNSKELIASAFYRDNKSNISVSLGDLFMENSKIIFRKERVFEIEKDIFLIGTEKKSDFNKIISEHKKKYKIESSLRDKYTRILSDEISAINKNQGFYPTIYHNVLNIETKETSLIQLRAKYIAICDDYFLETMILTLYNERGILILPHVDHDH